MSYARRISVIVVALLIGPAGCGGGPRYAKVSGTVTVDGRAYPNAIVSFQPLATAQNQAPGRGSSALTDENGGFTLVTDEGEIGAVVGKHRVRIQTKRDDPAAVFDPATGTPDGAGSRSKKPQLDPIPLDWYSDRSKKEFDVLPDGTDKANFDIVSKKTR